MTTRNYQEMSPKIVALCVQASIVSIHCRTVANQISEMMGGSLNPAVEVILAHLWTKADKDATEADKALKGCVHNAVNAKRKAAMESADFIPRENPSYLDNAEACLSLARDCATYCEAALFVAKQVAADSKTPEPNDAYEAIRKQFSKDGG